jgi:hypothetical protein
MASHFSQTYPEPYDGVRPSTPKKNLITPFNKFHIMGALAMRAGAIRPASGVKPKI